ncbi:YihY/virulence factor BrkB family protein [Roseateles sp.]|uniref:YihY/virulence factor BrkB family protein n=1 Tax=Roseateles sp. TaxID=1971397 RepID=UPI00286A6063|nr:YihY/virulence factor BrkB family protein [Roseateles sp.]
MRPAQLWRLCKQAGTAWIDDYAPSMGAALAYYTMFSIAPLLLIAISVAGLVFGREAASGEVLMQLRGLMGESGALAVQAMLESAARPAESWTAALIGGALLLLGATTVFGELQDALDRIWRAPQRNKPQGLWGLLRSRLLSFGMILGIGFLLTTSLLLSAAIAAFSAWSGAALAGWAVLAGCVNFVISYALVAAMFALIYKIMPRVRIAWRDVWIGAWVTALLFNIGKLLIGLYIGKSGVASAFGAAGSLAVLLLWVYYSAQIFLFGAEFTWAYAHSFGSFRQPSAQPDKVQTPPSKAGSVARAGPGPTG